LPEKIERLWANKEVAGYSPVENSPSWLANSPHASTRISVSEWPFDRNLKPMHRSKDERFGIVKSPRRGDLRLLNPGLQPVDNQRIKWRRGESNPKHFVDYQGVATEPAITTRLSHKNFADVPLLL
jgi:hypothetical protein